MSGRAGGDEPRDARADARGDAAVSEAPANPTGLALTDLPATFQVADAEATRAEGRFLGLVRGEIALPLVGVAAGVTAIWVLSVGVRRCDRAHARPVPPGAGVDRARSVLAGVQP